MTSSVDTPKVRASPSTSATPSITTPDKPAKLKNANSSSLSATLAGIDDCIRQWKAARHSGQAVLTSLSNTLLLRTHLDKGRNIPTITPDYSGKGGMGEANAESVWGVLAGAAGGSTVARVSVASEARVRRLHYELTSLQDAMLAAAGGLRRHASDARRLHFSLAPDVSTTCKAMPGAAAVAVGVTSAAEADQSGSGGGGIPAGHREQHIAGVESGQSPVSRSLAELAELVSLLSLSENTSDRRVRIEGDDSDGDEERGCSSFVGWGYGVGDVADSAADVADMLMKEALVTATITQGVTELVSRGDRDALTIYAAAWMMQPYLDARRMKELQKMAGAGKGARPKGVSR